MHTPSTLKTCPACDRAQSFPSYSAEAWFSSHPLKGVCLACRLEVRDLYRKSNRLPTKRARGILKRHAETAATRGMPLSGKALWDFCHRLAAKKRIECADRGVAFDLEARDLVEAYENQGGQCAADGSVTLEFGRTAEPSRKINLDRVVPGVGYVRGNVAFLSAAMNRRKQDSDVRDLELLTRYLQKFEQAGDVQF